MKKLRNLKAVTVLMLATFVSSCEKDDVYKNSEINQEITTNDLSNENKIRWSDFPEELKNATPLESITTETINTSKAYSYSVGPFGGRGGVKFDVNPPSGSRIHAIAIRGKQYIDKIIVYYKAPNGSIYQGLSTGGNGGDYSLMLFSNDEYIKSIYGRSGQYLDHLTIQTNKGSYSHGGNGGYDFNVVIPPTGFHVLGFYGRSGSYIDQIGFHIHTL